MSAPLIWIVFPLMMAVVLYFLRMRTPLVIILAGICTFSLAALALLMPIASIVRLGPLSFEISATLNVLGRRLVLENGDRTLLAFVYLVAGFWFLAARAAGTQRLFIPFGLAMVVLLVAAAAVEPFLYAALLIEMAVLVSVPMLAPPGQPTGQGVLRYLIFQTLAMPFILFAGWALGAIEANPSDAHLYPLAEVFLGLGFAFWLAVFPFYTWLPLLSEQSHPYVAGFVLTLLSSVTLVLWLSFLDTFAWLRTSELLFTGFRLTGLLMVASGGIWAAFERNYARLIGYALIIEAGFSILALSLGNTAGLKLFTQLFFPRAVGLAVFSLALGIWGQQDHFRGFDKPEGLLWRLPVMTTALLLAFFSLGALPVLAGFPPRLTLLEALAAQSLADTLAALLGSIGFLVGGLRMLVQVTTGERLPPQSERPSHMLMLGVGAVMLLVLGLLPDWFLPRFHDLLLPFTHLR